MWSLFAYFYLGIIAKKCDYVLCDKEGVTLLGDYIYCNKHYLQKELEAALELDRKDELSLGKERL